MDKAEFSFGGNDFYIRDDRFFIRFDEGHFVIKYVEYKITKKEYEEARHGGEEIAQRIVYRCQATRRPRVLSNFI